MEQINKSLQVSQMEQIDELRNAFLELLKNENSSYKYKSQYYDYLVGTKDDIYVQLMNMRLFIMREWRTCRGHNPNEGPFENEILILSKQILLKQMSTYLEIYNNLLENEKTIQYELNVNPDCLFLSYKINFDFIAEHTDKTKYDIVQNLSAILNLKSINNIQQNNFIVESLSKYFSCLTN
jgi:hypothetical protein